MTERQQIVEWLRDRWANGPGTSAELWLAAAIERGEHLPARSLNKRAKKAKKATAGG